MAEVNLFGRTGGSSWAQEAWVNVAPASTPVTSVGKAVAGVKTPREVTVSQGQITADTGVTDTGAPARPPGVLMSSYASFEPSRAMYDYLDKQNSAYRDKQSSAVGSSFDEVKTFLQRTPEVALSQEEIQDISGDLQGRWNFGEMSAPNALVVHHTAGGGTAEGVVQTFTERNFPAHFVIDREGQVTQVLGLNQKGQHTKPAQDGSGITNSNSWGVEVIAKDDSDILPVQAAATARLSKYLQTYGLDPKRIVGHGEINSHKQATEGQSIVSLLREING